VFLSSADRHDAELLQLTGRDGKRIMASTLTWLMQAEGAGGGGFFATHPATEDRIERVQASATGTARKEYTPRV
jgi:predicted Zn-dependent protease